MKRHILNAFLVGFLFTFVTACFHAEEEETDSAEEISVTIEADQVLDGSSTSITAMGDFELDGMAISGSVMIMGDTGDTVTEVLIIKGYAGEEGDDTDASTISLVEGDGGMWSFADGLFLDHMSQHMPMGMGQMYVSVRDASGEILRGQIEIAGSDVHILDLEASDGVTTTATGIASVTAIGTDNKIVAFVEITGGLASGDVSAVHIHDGSTAGADAAIVTLTELSADPLIYSVAATSITDHWDAAEAGELYINVHTTANATGELTVAIPAIDTHTDHMHEDDMADDGHNHMH